MGNAAKKIWPLAVIVGLWLTFSAPYFFKGLVPFPSTYLATFFPPWSAYYGMPVKNNAMPDVITQIYPWKRFTIDTWKSGAVPLWNPYSFSGTPQAGNYQSAVFTPFNLLFFVLPFVDAWSILILLQPLLAALGMYVYLRSLARSKEAALLGSIAFMFCGFIVVWMAYGTLGYAVLWLPVIFWGIEKRKGAAVSLGVVLSLVAGHFQASTYVVGAAVLYAIWKRQLSSLWFTALGILIALPQILPGLHSFFQSTRGVGTLKGDVIPWQYLITFVSPDFFGNPVTRNDWFGHYAEWAGFVGVTPLLLALFAVTRKKSSEIWFFIMLAAAAILLALPTPLNDLLYILHIPVLSGSAASRIIILVSFSLAVLAAYGADSLRVSWKFIFGGAVVLIFLWGLIIFGNVLPPDKLSIAKHNFIMPSIFVSVTLILFLVRKKFVLYVLIALTAFDILRFAIKWMPFDPRQYVYPAVKSLSYLQEHAGVSRVFGNIGNEVGSTYGIQLVDGYDAVYQARYGEFVNAVSKGYIYPGMRSVVQFDKNGLYKTEALQLLGIRYIYHRFSDGRVSWVFPYWEYPGMRQVYSDEVYEIFEYPDAYPRAFLASSYVGAGSDKEIIDTLFSKDFNRRDTLVLEEKPDISPAAGTASAQIVTYKPDTVTIKTDSNSPKLLFLSDVFDAGWRATVDGRSSKIYRADYDFRAVAVPAGVHSVTFSYVPGEFLWGIILSGVGIVLLIITRK